MKKMTKIVMLSASLLGLTTLSACQTHRTAHGSHMHMMHEQHDERGMMDDAADPHDMATGQNNMPYHNKSHEHRMQWDKHRAEHQAHFEQVRKACEGKKAGQAVQVKLGEKTIEGTCELRFQPKNPMPHHMTPMMQDQNKAAS